MHGFSTKRVSPTFAVVEVQSDGLALVDVQVGEPHGESEQHQQQQQLKLLPDFLHREAQHPRSDSGAGNGQRALTSATPGSCSTTFPAEERRLNRSDSQRALGLTHTHTHNSHSDVRLDARGILAALAARAVEML